VSGVTRYGTLDYLLLIDSLQDYTSASPVPVLAVGIKITR